MEWNWGIYLFGWLGIALHLLTKFMPDIISDTEVSFKPFKMKVAAYGAAISAISYTLIYAAGAEGMLDKIVGASYSWGFFTAGLMGFSGSSIFQNIAAPLLKSKHNAEPAEG